MSSYWSKNEKQKEENFRIRKCSCQKSKVDSSWGFVFFILFCLSFYLYLSLICESVNKFCSIINIMRHPIFFLCGSWHFFEKCILLFRNEQYYLVTPWGFFPLHCDHPWDCLSLMANVSMFQMFQTELKNKFSSGLKMHDNFNVVYKNMPGLCTEWNTVKRKRWVL